MQLLYVLDLNICYTMSVATIITIMIVAIIVISIFVVLCTWHFYLVTYLVTIISGQL